MLNYNLYSCTIYENNTSHLDVIKIIMVVSSLFSVIVSPKIITINDEIMQQINMNKSNLLIFVLRYGLLVRIQGAKEIRHCVNYLCVTFFQQI